MANSTCSITSISDLLDKVDRNLLNVTTTIASCPNICSLAWGKGNPDLSGIGLNVSYIMQAILAVLCGPILALIYSLRHRLGLDERTQVRLSEIHHSFIDISAAFNIPVAIAAVIRIRQFAPFFEQYFLLFLVGMQSCSFVSVACALPVFDKRHRRSVHTTPLYLGVQGILLFITFMLLRSISRWGSIKELIAACNNYGQVLPFFVEFSEQSSKPILYHFVQGLMVAMFAVPILLGVLFTFKIARRMFLGESKEFQHVDRRQKASQRMGRAPVFIVVIAVLTMILMTSIMIVVILLLQRMRSKLRAITGRDFQDDQWGFGQTIAVFLWIPLCLQLVYCVICFAWSRFCMISGRRVQWIRRMVDQIIGVFKDDEDEMDNGERPQVISQVRVENHREYVALE